MAKQTMEEEILEALKMKQGAKEKRADFLQEVGNKSFDITDKAWAALSEDAQSWIEDAQKAYNKDKQVAEFRTDEPVEEDRGGRQTRRGADDEKSDDRRGRGRDDDKEKDEKDDDRRSSRSSRDEPEEDRRSSRRDEPDEDRRSSRRDEPEEDRRSSRSSRDEPEEDRRSSRRGDDDKEKDGDKEERGGRSSRRGGDDDKEKDEDRGGRQTRSRDDDKASDDKQETLPANVKTKIRELLFDNPGMTPDAIIKEVNSRSTISKVLVADVKASFRDVVKFLQDKKALKKNLL